MTLRNNWGTETLYILETWKSIMPMSRLEMQHNYSCNKVIIYYSSHEDLKSLNCGFRDEPNASSLQE